MKRHFLRRLRRVLQTVNWSFAIKTFYAVCSWETAHLASSELHLEDRPLEEQSCQLHLGFRAALIQREKDRHDEPKINQSDMQNAMQHK